MVEVQDCKLFKGQNEHLNRKLSSQNRILCAYLVGKLLWFPNWNSSVSILLGQPALIGDLNGLKSLQSFNILEIRLLEQSTCNICHGHLFDPHLNNQLL